ncbi:MAG: response regulator [Patescibacteria group bacterium]
MKNESGITVALVEDEEVLLNVLAQKLRKEGYTVLTAADGERGLAVIKEQHPDVVLLDIVMPKMDGFQVLEQMHADAELARIPVIIISNSGQPVEIDRALALGVKDYLIKAEFDPQEVLDKLKKQVVALGKKLPRDGGVTPEGAPAIDPSKFHVLLVEDDEFLRDLIVQKMKKVGFQVSEAVDGESGFRKVVEEKPSIVLLDLILPGVDGFETLTKIRAEKQVAKTPVIILSNLGQKDDIDRGMQLGATDYLVKAHNTPGEIIEKIKSVLAAHHV